MTTPTAALLDTDTLSAILRRNPVVTTRAQDYLRSHHRFTFSIITRYEILRGLKARRATKQQAAFDRFCAANTVLPLSDAIVVRAAEIYADLYQRGELIGDADILIAATTIIEGYDLATNNERHFERIEGQATVRRVVCVRRMVLWTSSRKGGDRGVGHLPSRLCVA